MELASYFAEALSNDLVTYVTLVSLFGPPAFSAALTLYNEGTTKPRQ